VQFVVILNIVLGHLYCGLQFSLETTLAALLTLYVAVFGVQILMGTAQLSSGDIMVRLLKMPAYGRS